MVVRDCIDWFRINVYEDFPVLLKTIPRLIAMTALPIRSVLDNPKIVTTRHKLKARKLT
jgi:hypothetical protein